MSRYSRSHANEVWFPIFILIGLMAWMHRKHLLNFNYIFLGFISFFLLIKLAWKSLHRRRFNPPKNVDVMNGLDFERYVAKLLQAKGFCKVSLTERYDYGVDIIAEKDGMRWGIQAKRHSGLVKANAVRQVVTGLKMYDCDRAMVITNSTYSTVARRLAHANDCVLVDRARLNRLVQQGCIL